MRKPADRDGKERIQTPYDVEARWSEKHGAGWTGYKLQVTEILVDCDDDTVLLKVKRLGDGNVCHTGERTCFYRTLA